RELVSYGAYIEHCYTTWATGKVDYSITQEQIKAIGADHVILATDLGQTTSIYPDEGMLEFSVRLLKEGGMSEQDIRKMTVDNPTALIK
ncbi:MAG: cytosolic protein, partial [Angelakisella sp.]